MPIKPNSDNQLHLLLSEYFVKEGAAPDTHRTRPLAILHCSGEGSLHTDIT